MINDIQNYIDSATDQRRDLYLQVVAKLKELLPDISTKMAYGVIKYFNSKGYIYLGYWKGGVSIYPGNTTGIAQFRERNPQIKTRIGTINLRLTDQIPWDELLLVFKESFKLS
ncbi:MAG: hypothetical protein CVU49_08825 [Candidatus Cloacimonetes bacterium HGW-Cloacimonetes-2]|jgi:uncharacterized protein YdhG (YjbR/CyaY superfamily)|nr:MAG: hypothetical protein CVU49_08825 [Candidatus Cloacimonetes bacterium HGW-Cloacimonetes-2]